MKLKANKKYRFYSKEFDVYYTIMREKFFPWLKELVTIIHFEGKENTLYEVDIDKDEFLGEVEFSRSERKKKD